MRRLARYAFSAIDDQKDTVDATWSSARERIDDWLRSKGMPDGASSEGTIRFADGRQANLRLDVASSSIGEACHWTIVEPIPTGLFKTVLALGRCGNEVAFSCELEAGSPPGVIAPVDAEARCPFVVREVLGAGSRWRVGESIVSTGPLRFAGTAAGGQLRELIRSPERSVPIVVVSEQNGFLIQPNLPAELARDLSGLAIVCSTDHIASWGLTRALGPRWSCFDGGIRLYWPFLGSEGDPYRHPLWTVARLMESARDTAHAAQRIRTELRQRVLELSAFTSHGSDLFRRIESAHRSESLAAAEQTAEEGNTWKQLASEVGVKLKESRDEAGSLQDRIRELEHQIAGLSTDLENQRQINAWSFKPSEAGAAPVERRVPETVRDAVIIAQSEYADFLLFGEDVDKGIESLSPDAGPPQKVLEYLDALVDLALTLSDGPLGTSQIGWLNQKNIVASGESEGIHSVLSNCA